MILCFIGIVYWRTMGVVFGLYITGIEIGLVGLIFDTSNSDLSS